MTTRQRKKYIILFSADAYFRPLRVANAGVEMDRKRIRAAAVLDPTARRLLAALEARVTLVLWRHHAAQLALCGDTRSYRYCSAWLQLLQEMDTAIAAHGYSYCNAWLYVAHRYTCCNNYYYYYCNFNNKE